MSQPTSAAEGYNHDHGVGMDLHKNSNPRELTNNTFNSVQEDDWYESFVSREHAVAPNDNSGEEVGAAFSNRDGSISGISYRPSSSGQYGSSSGTNAVTRSRNDQPRSSTVEQSARVLRSSTGKLFSRKQSPVIADGCPPRIIKKTHLRVPKPRAIRKKSGQKAKNEQQKPRKVKKVTLRKLSKPATRAPQDDSTRCERPMIFGDDGDNQWDAVQMMGVVGQEADDPVVKFIPGHITATSRFCSQPKEHFCFPQD